MTETITAEQVLRARQLAMATAGAHRSTEESAIRTVTMDTFTTAIEALASRLAETGFPGGEIRKRWMGRDISENVAVWYLEVDLLGCFWFSPTLKAVLTNPLNGSDDVRRHARDAASKDRDHHRHHAIAEGWLIRMDSEPYTYDLQALTQALIRLYAR